MHLVLDLYSSFNVRFSSVYFYHLFYSNTYALPATQCAAVTTHLGEINDPPQIKRPLRFRAICKIKKYKNITSVPNSKFSRVIVCRFNGKLNNRCFCYFRAAMVVPLEKAPSWLLHKKNSVNLLN